MAHAHRRTIPRRALELIAVGGLALSLAGWAWHTYNRAADQNDEDETDTAPVASTSALPAIGKARPGTKQQLTIAARNLPPAALLSELSTHFTTTLVLPSHTPFPLTTAYLNASAPFSSHRIAFHSTAEGLTHIARSLGGWLVLVSDQVDGGVSSGDEEDEAGGGKGKERSTRVEVDWRKTSQNVGTFVKVVIRVLGSSEEEPEGEASARVVRGWDGLRAILGC